LAIFDIESHSFLRNLREPVVERAIGDAVARVNRNSASLSTDLKRSEFIWSQGQFYLLGSHLE